MGQLSPNPTPGGRYNNLGNALRDQRKLPDAVAAYRKAIDLNPEFAMDFENLGQALGEQRKFREAIGPFRKAIDL